jgi:DnaJ domain
MFRNAVSRAELVAAYGTLGVERAATKDAIRARYRELAQIHHPDHWPSGSLEHAEAHTRMREINVAYDLIRKAPLQHEGFGDMTPDPAFQPPPSRAVASLVEFAIEFLIGVLAGGAIAMLLSYNNVPGRSIYQWAIPLLLGFTGTWGVRFFFFLVDWVF